MRSKHYLLHTTYIFLYVLGVYKFCKKVFCSYNINLKIKSFENNFFLLDSCLKLYNFNRSFSTLGPT
jgi:hypothetical protein